MSAAGCGHAPLLLHPLLHADQEGTGAELRRLSCGVDGEKPPAALRGCPGQRPRLRWRLTGNDTAPTPPASTLPASARQGVSGWSICSLRAPAGVVRARAEPQLQWIFGGTLPRVPTPLRRTPCLGLLPGRPRPNRRAPGAGPCPLRDQPATVAAISPRSASARVGGWRRSTGGR
jgi:hypothetical protein